MLAVSQPNGQPLHSCLQQAAGHISAPVPIPGWTSSTRHTLPWSLPPDLCLLLCLHLTAGTGRPSPSGCLVPPGPPQLHVCGRTWVQWSRKAAHQLRPRCSRRGEWLLVQWAPAFSIHVLMNHLTKMQPNSRRICSEQCGFVEGTAALRFPRQDPSSSAKLLCASQEPEHEQGDSQGSQMGAPEESPAGIPGTRRQG